MSLKNQLNQPLITLTVLGVAFVLFFYGKIILAPNQYMLSASGDGMKNYFTYAYHIQHDSGYTNFEGMNYPYGESHMYTDSHPLLSNLIKVSSTVFPGIATYSIGIINILLILSIFFSFIVVYQLLRFFNINEWLAVLLSLGITALSPQIFRLQGHLALSYSVAIPLNWLLTVYSIKRKSYGFLIALFFSNLIWLFTHAYLGIISLSLTLFIPVFYILFNSIPKKQFIHITSLLLANILPILLFFVYVNLTDIHVDRTNNPSGFFLYNAEIDDLLIPPKEPFFPLLNQLSGGKIKLQWEARAYTGLLNSLFLIFLVITGLMAIFRKKTRSLLAPLFKNKLLNASLLSAFLALLFAMGIPFVQIDGLIDFFPILKVFRATGRFTWPFYFVFSVFGAFAFHLILNHLIKEKNKRIIPYFIMIIYVLTMGIESFYYHQPISKKIENTVNIFDREQLPDYFKKALNTIDPNQFQAIIALPFHHYGSEVFSRPSIDETAINSMILSYHTGLPNFCTNLTRVSITETKKIIQLVSPNFYDKPIVNDLTTNKDFILLKTNHSLTDNEKIIYNKANSIFVCDDFELLEISFNDLFSDDRFQLKMQFDSIKNQLISKEEFLLNKKTDFLFYNSFVDRVSDTSFRGAGAFTAPKKGRKTLAYFEPHNFKKNQEYQLSIWMYHKKPNSLNEWLRLIVEEYNAEKNEWYSTTFFPEEAETLTEEWSLIEGQFRVRNPKNTISVLLIGTKASKATLIADDLLIREAETDVYQWDSTKNELFFNNQKIIFN